MLLHALYNWKYVFIRNTLWLSSIKSIYVILINLDVLEVLNILQILLLVVAVFQTLIIFLMYVVFPQGKFFIEINIDDKLQPKQIKYIFKCFFNAITCYFEFINLISEKRKEGKIVIPTMQYDIFFFFFTLKETYTHHTHVRCGDWIRDLSY